MSVTDGDPGTVFEDPSGVRWMNWYGGLPVLTPYQYYFGKDHLEFSNATPDNFGVAGNIFGGARYLHVADNWSLSGASDGTIKVFGDSGELFGTPVQRTGNGYERVNANGNLRGVGLPPIAIDHGLSWAHSIPGDAGAGKYFRGVTAITKDPASGTVTDATAYVKRSYGQTVSHTMTISGTIAAVILADTVRIDFAMTATTTLVGDTTITVTTPHTASASFPLKHCEVLYALVESDSSTGSIIGSGSRPAPILDGRLFLTEIYLAYNNQPSEYVDVQDGTGSWLVSTSTAYPICGYSANRPEVTLDVLPDGSIDFSLESEPDGAGKFIRSKDFRADGDDYLIDFEIVDGATVTPQSCSEATSVKITEVVGLCGKTYTPPSSGE